MKDIGWEVKAALKPFSCLGVVIRDGKIMKDFQLTFENPPKSFLFQISKFPILDGFVYEGFSN